MAARIAPLEARRHVHRDVKPENILFDRSGHAYLGDFGIAKVLDEAARDPATRNLSRTGTLQGTPWYMAPERINHEAYDGRADQYALAVIVFELLSGRFPVGEAANPFKTALAQVTDAPQVLCLASMSCGRVLDGFSRVGRGPQQG